MKAVGRPSRRLARVLALVAPVSLALFSLAACSKDNEIDQSTSVNNASCTKSEVELAKLCPPNTSLEIASGASACTGDTKDAQGNTVAVCKTEASCSVRCKVVQVCGNGTCEANERESCAPDAKDCFPCAKDCAGKCKSGDPICVGNKVLLCGPSGEPTTELVDCTSTDQLCALGKCVAKGACGNKICEPGESPQSCPDDCSSECTPGKQFCQGTTLFGCGSDGKKISPGADCSAQGKDCSAALGQCVAKDVCGNKICEAGEDKSCPEDCEQSVCGNKKCDPGESPQSCAQDCGGGTVCVPNSRECIGSDLLVCQPDGAKQNKYECAAFGQVCGNGACVKPDQCGNGVCESGEESSCKDCAAQCGDGTCDKGQGESFSTCSKDCKPECGDGACEGDETGTSCIKDCSKDCGDGACDAGKGESYETCPVDCGSCGDGKCDEAFESPLSLPPAGKVSCLVDCVKTSGCSKNEDCEDFVGCTVNTCQGGECKFAPDDSACNGSNEKCVPFQGCCADKDGDGSLDAACGGNDCDDSDKTVYFGAPEVCGGGDKNCNGKNELAVVDAKEILMGGGAKASVRFASSSAGDLHIAVWAANESPGTPRELRFGIFDSEGNTKSAPASLDSNSEHFAVEKFSVVYSPKHDNDKGAFAVAWMYLDSAKKQWNGALQWIDPSTGKVESPDSPVILENIGTSSSGVHLAWANDTYVVMARGSTNGTTYHAVSEVGGATMYTVSNGIALGGLFALNGGQFVALDYANSSLGLLRFSPGKQPSFSAIADWKAAFVNDKLLEVMDSDGTQLHSLAAWGAVGDSLNYRTVDPAGSAGPAKKLYTGKQTPLSIRHLAGADGQEAQIAGLATDGGTVNFFTLKQDGSVALDFNPVSKGKEISSGTIFKKKTGDLAAVWSSKPASDASHLLYFSTIGCL